MITFVPGSESAQDMPLFALPRIFHLDHVIDPQSENGMENSSFKGVEKGLLHQNGCAKPFSNPAIVLYVENAEL